MSDVSDLDVLRNRLEWLQSRSFGLGSSPIEIGEWLIDIGRLNLQLAARTIDALENGRRSKPVD